MPSSTDSIKDPAGTPGAEKDTAAGETKKPIDMRTMVGDPDFLDFNHGYGDKEDLDKIPPTELEKRYEAFKNKKVLQEALPALFDEHIKDELGIELGPEGKRALGDFLDKQARTPDGLKKFVENWRAVEAKKKEVAESDALITHSAGEGKREAYLAGLKTEEDGLRKQKELVAGLDGGSRVFRKAREWGWAGKKAQDLEKERKHIREMPERERLAFFADVDKKLAAITAKERIVTAAGRGEGYKAEFDEKRKAFFAGFEGTKTIYAAVLAKSWEQAVKAFESGKASLEDAEKAQAALEKIAGIKDKLPSGVTLEAATVGLPTVFTAEKLGLLQRDINGAIEGAAHNIVAKALEEYKPHIKAEFVRELEELVKPIAGKERLGAKKGETVHEFVRGEVEKYRDSFTERTAALDDQIKNEEKLITEIKDKLPKDRLDEMEANLNALKEKKADFENKKLALGCFLATSKVEAGKRAADAETEEKEHMNRDEIEARKENFERDLKARRDAYISEYKEYIKAKKGGADSRIQMAELYSERRHEKYSELLETYAKALYGYEKEELEKQGFTGEKLAEKLKFFQANNIFAEFFVKEQQELEDAKAETWPPKERSRIRGALTWMATRPRWQRIAFSGFCAAGFAAVSGPGGAAAAGVAFGFGALRSTVRMAGFMGAMAGLSQSFKWWDKTGGREATKAFKVEQFRFGNKLVDNFAKERENYAKILEQAAKRERRRQIAKLAVGLAMGGVSSYYGAVINHAIDSMGVGALSRLESAAGSLGIGGGAPHAAAAAEAAAGAPAGAAHEAASVEGAPAPLPETGAPEIRTTHGSIKLSVGAEGSAVIEGSSVTHAGLRGDEYFGTGAKETFSDMPSTDEVVIRGKALGAYIRFYEELKAGGNAEQAALVKPIIANQIQWFTEHKSAGFLNHSKLFGFEGVPSIEAVASGTPPAETAPEPPTASRPEAAPATGTAPVEAAPPPSAAAPAESVPPPPAGGAEHAAETAPTAHKDGSYPKGLEPSAPAAEAVPATARGAAPAEAAPAAGGRPRLDAIPAEPVFAGEFTEPADLRVADWGPKIETQSANVTFGYNAEHEPVSVVNTARENNFLFLRLGQRAIAPDPDHFFADGYESHINSSNGDELMKRGAELDRLVQIKKELSEQMTGKMPRGLARENEFLLRNIRKQLFALEDKYGVGVLDHSKLPSDIRGLVDIPMEGGLNPQYDDFGKVTGFEPNPSLVDKFPDYVLFPKEDTQGLVEQWARQSDIGDFEKAQLHLVHECKQLAFEINTYKGMEAANFAGRGYGKVMDALREDMQHRLAEIQKVDVPVIDQSKLPDYLRAK